MKPRIKRGMILLKQFPPVLVQGWHCSSQEFCGSGITPKAAYEEWYRVARATAAWNRVSLISKSRPQWWSDGGQWRAYADES